MFERFTEQARQVVVLAQDEARLIGHNYIGTEHLILGLLRVDEGLAARALHEAGVTLEDARALVHQTVGEGEEATAGQIPFTPNAKKVLEHALREARQLGDDYIGTEHILLGLLSIGGRGVEALEGADVRPDAIRETIVRLLSDSGDARPAAAPSAGPFQRIEKRLDEIVQRLEAIERKLDQL